MTQTDTGAQVLRKIKNDLIKRYAVRNNRIALTQTLSTLLPVIALTYAGIAALDVSMLLASGIVLLLTLFLLRAFVMLHDCGHNCLYESPGANKIAGFIFGVVCGVPQYVWSRHHDYHHSTNGNWEKYRGPLTVLSTEEYSELTPKQKRRYARQRKLFMGPLAGFLYFVFNPRFTWFKGTLGLFAHILKGKKASEYSTRYWADWKEFRHMTANNLALLSIWTLASMTFGFAEFAAVFIVALSLAGASGIILFTVQHNFENSYASPTEGWDYYRAALAGTSYLKLPRILHWFTADIGYHHIHHLSARIPNYRLRECHEQNRALFESVTRLTLKDVPHSMRYIIWDENNATLKTPEQFEARNAAAAVTEAAQAA